MDRKLSKNEIISSSRNIGGLISRPEGVFSVYPLKLFWSESSSNSNSPVKVAFLVSRKNFKKAVTRNLIKRRMRAAYRNNKQDLLKSSLSNKIHLDILFLYKAREVVPHTNIQMALEKMLHQLAVKISVRNQDA